MFYILRSVTAASSLLF